MNYIKNFLWVAGAVYILLIVSSCRTRKDVIYYQPPKDTTSQSNIKWKNFPVKDSSFIKPYDPIIKQNDILEVYVSSINPEAASFFNTNAVQSVGKEFSGYLVDVNGEIELPLLGSVKVAGMSVPEIRNMLKAKLEKYLEQPSVRVVFQNFQVTILGDVKSPGVYSVINERITFPEAIARAGDLLITARRNNILIVREENGKKEFGTVNILQRDLFESPYYFLHPNDMIYVEPVASKIESSDAFFRWYSFVLTSITFFTIVGLRFIK